MKKLLLLALIVCFTAVAGFAALPEKVTIDAAAAKQPGVTFPHAKHVAMGKSCDTCHHTQKGITEAKAAEVQKCTSCHLDPKPDVPGIREMSMSKNAFHIKCVGCHKAEKKGPAVCKDCHVK